MAPQPDAAIPSKSQDRQPPGGASHPVVWLSQGVRQPVPPYSELQETTTL